MQARMQHLRESTRSGQMHPVYEVQSQDMPRVQVERPMPGLHKSERHSPGKHPNDQKREYGKCSAVLAGRLKRPKFGSLPAWPAIRLTVIIPLVFDAPPMAPHLEILFSLGSSQIGQENFVYSPYP